MGRQVTKQLTRRPNDDVTACDRARSGYYAAMTDLETVESNLRRKITRREWSAFRDMHTFEVFT